MSIRERLKDDLPNAIKLRDSAAVTAIRTMLAAIDNAEAVDPRGLSTPVYGRTNDVPRKLLTAQDIQDIVQHEAVARQSAIVKYQQLGSHDAASQLRAELDVINRYLDEPGEA